MLRVGRDPQYTRFEGKFLVDFKVRPAQCREASGPPVYRPTRLGSDCFMVEIGCPFVGKQGETLKKKVLVPRSVTTVNRVLSLGIPESLSPAEL